MSRDPTEPPRPTEETPMPDALTFVPFPKIGRLSREVIVTEKIDGTNAGVQIIRMTAQNSAAAACSGNVTSGHPIDDGTGDVMVVIAQSRSQIIAPGRDNHGFAAWVRANAETLLGLGEGAHFGEWWGSGIQRGYGMPKGEKRFSLFNVHRWADDAVRPSCCHVVPELWRGTFDTAEIRDAMQRLVVTGSVAAPGFMKPEGVVIFHAQGNILLKKTLERDEAGKEHGA